MKRFPSPQLSVTLCLCLAVAALILGLHLAQADGTKPVTIGWVVRGVTLPGAGNPGEATGKTCDFSQEDVDQAGYMVDASVNCKQGGEDLSVVMVGLPARFNAYCAIKVSTLPRSARLIAAPVPENAQHCSLSAIKPQDAQQIFGGSVWR